jgi:hypothetical protein
VHASRQHHLESAFEKVFLEATGLQICLKHSYDSAEYEAQRSQVVRNFTAPTPTDHYDIHEEEEPRQFVPRAVARQDIDVDVDVCLLALFYCSFIPLDIAIGLQGPSATSGVTAV